MTYSFEYEAEACDDGDFAELLRRVADRIQEGCTVGEGWNVKAVDDTEEDDDDE